MVTIPTIDQFSGTTVMNKVRELIRTFIGFANEVDTALTVTIPDYVDSHLQNYYTKAETLNITNQIDAKFNNYYSKDWLDAKFDTYYTKVQIDNFLATKQDTFSCELPMEKFDFQNRPYIRLKYANGTFKLTSQELDLDMEKVINKMNIQAPLYVPLDEFSLPTGVLGVKYDNDTIKVNQDGELYADVGGADYTASKPLIIDINNNIKMGEWELVDNTYIQNNFSNDFFKNHEILITQTSGAQYAYNQGQVQYYYNPVMYNLIPTSPTYSNNTCPLIQFNKKDNYYQNIYKSQASGIWSLTGHGTKNTNYNLAAPLICYDMNGNKITASNVSSYIDATNGVLKPFIFSLDSGSKRAINIIISPNNNSNNGIYLLHEINNGVYPVIDEMNIPYSSIISSITEGNDILNVSSTNCVRKTIENGNYSISFNSTGIRVFIREYNIGN